MSEEKTSRRAVLGAAVVGAGVAAAGLPAAAAGAPQAARLNKAKAVMPDGSMLDRVAVLTKLGLDPSTPPDAWLTVVACGSNASALTREQIRTLTQSGKLKAAQLDARTRRKAGL